eukprot:scaffold47562_cov29-Tisochrysis_lutea.AAC.3
MRKEVCPPRAIRIKPLRYVFAADGRRANGEKCYSSTSERETTLPMDGSQCVVASRRHAISMRTRDAAEAYIAIAIGVHIGRKMDPLKGLATLCRKALMKIRVAGSPTRTRAR